MASVKYFIRSNKKGSEEVAIYARLRTGKIDIRVCTGLSVPFNLWNDIQGCIKPFYQKDAETVKRLERTESELKDIKGLLFNIADSSPEISVKEVSDYIYNRKNEMYHFSKRNVHKNTKKSLAFTRLNNAFRQALISLRIPLPVRPLRIL